MELKLAENTAKEKPVAEKAEKNERVTGTNPSALAHLRTLQTEMQRIHNVAQTHSIDEACRTELVHIYQSLSNILGVMKADLVKNPGPEVESLQQ